MSDSSSLVDPERRRAWQRIATAISTLQGATACGGGGAGSGSGLIAAAPAPAPASASASASAASPNPEPSAAAGAAQASPPPIPPNNAKYRSEQPLLWSPVAQRELPSRLPGGSALPLDRVGPTADFVALSCSWPWRQRGGDWVDANGVLHGTKPWARFAANSASGPTARFTYQVDITMLVQTVFSAKRWFALMVRPSEGAAPRVIAGLASANPPQITLRHADGTQETQVCTVSASIQGSSAYPSTLAADMQLPLLIEFLKPARTVSGATLTLTVSQHWSGSASLDIMLVDPPLNVDSPTPGIGSGADFDAGLVDHPRVLGMHRMVDTDSRSDHFFTSTGAGINYNAGAAYSPDILGSGAADPTKLPYSVGNKIVANSGWNLLPSTSAAPGFKPLAAGVGALRFVREREVQADGEVVGYGLNSDASFKCFLPPQEMGRLAEAYVRYYIRLQPLPAGMGVRKQVHKQANDLPVWCDLAGKFGIGFAHDTTEGGVSGSSGGGAGWQLRTSWVYWPEVLAGPDAGCISIGVHFFDFLYRNPPGHNYGVGGGSHLKPGDDSLSQRGALGALYPNHWYCIEQRLKLNSIDKPGVLADGSPHVVDGVRQYWSPDGELDFWIDGRLACSVRNLVLRTAPLLIRNGASLATYMPPVRELGIRDVWHNFFHGGLTKMPIGMTCDISGLVWARDYIGPMRGVSSASMSTVVG